MKKMMHMIFSFSLSFLIFASNICLAARPMTEQESVQFTSKIKTYFSNNFIKRINMLTIFKDCPADDRFEKKFDLKKIEELTDSFEKNNNEFDEANGLDANDKLMFFGDDKDFSSAITITKGIKGIFINFKDTSRLSWISKGGKKFREAITLYHTHISNELKFLKQPLCCRALSAYILHELIEMGIECKYVKYTVLGNKEDHDVVAYKVEDKWYVCDLMFALNSEILHNCCRNPGCIKEYGDLLKMPMDEYKKSMKASNTWDEIEITPDILKLDYSIVIDHRNKFSKLEKIIDFLSHKGTPMPIKNFIN